MKKSAVRSLHLETLEVRQLLDAASILDVGAGYMDQPSVVSEAVKVDEVVDLSNAQLDETNSEVVFIPTEVKRVYTMDWADMEGAASYNVKISRDGGETWITYRKTTDSECEVRGLYSNETYMFRIYAVNETGKLDKASVVETSFTPEETPAGRDEIGFTSTGNAREYTMEWKPQEGAVEYHVRISRDGGETWLQYRPRTESTSCEVNGLYSGRTYMFQVIATNAEGRTLADGIRYTIFSPVGVSGNLTEYKAGDTLKASVFAADGASAELNWYLVTPYGDVEIAGTAGQSAIATISNDFPVKVVATGTEDGEGSSASYVFNPTPSTMAVEIASPYHTVNRTIELSWSEVDGAAKYVVQKYGPSGSWIKAAVLDADTTSYTISMFSAEETKTYRVVAQDANGATLDKGVVTYESVPAVMANTESYKTFYIGDTYVNNATVNVDAAEGSTFAWSYSTNGGATWTKLNTTSSSYTVDKKSPLFNRNYILKAVATDPEGRESVVYSYPYTITEQPINLEKSLADDGKLVMNFLFTGDEDSFEFQYNLDGVWVRLTNVTVVNNGDGRFTATYPNSAGTMQENKIRVRARDNNGAGVSYWNDLLETPSVFVTTADDVVDPEDGVVSLREALLYYDYLVSTGEISASDPITFDPVVFTDGTVIKLAPQSAAKVNYPGVYENATVGGPLVVNFNNASNIVVDGSAANVVVESSKADANAFVVTTTGALDSYELTLDGVDVRNSQNGVLVSGANVTLNVENSEFTGNKTQINATGAGAEINVVNSTLANGENGVVARSANSSVTIFDSTLSNFTTAAVNAEGAHVTIGKSVVSDSKVGVSGKLASFTVANTLFTNNQTGVAAQASSNNADSEIVNVTVMSPNKKMETGVKLENFNNVTVVNSVFWDSAKEDVVLKGGKNGTKTIVDSLVQKKANVEGNNKVGEFSVAAKNVARPLDETGDILDYSVMTTTGDSFYLLDGGDDSYVVGDVDVYGADRVLREHVDVGAVEHSQYERPSLVVTTTDDVVDPFDEVVSLREAILYREYLVSTGKIDESAAITFDSNVFVEGAVLALSTEISEPVSFPGVYENATSGGVVAIDSSLVIDGSNAFVTVDANGANAFVVDPSKLETIDFTLRGVDVQNADSPVYLNLDENDGVTLADITIDDCVFSNSQNGLYLRADSENAALRINVTDSDFENIRNDAVYVQANGDAVVNVANIEVHNSMTGVNVKFNANADAVLNVDHSEFEEIMFGVRAENGELNVSGSTFEKVDGTAIVGDTTDSASVNSSVFTNVTEGVHLVGSSDETVLSNLLFRDVVYGVNAEGVEDLKITNNTFYGVNNTMRTAVSVEDSNVFVANTLVWNYERASETWSDGDSLTVVNSIVGNGVAVDGVTDGKFEVAAANAKNPLNKTGGLDAERIKTVDGTNFDLVDGGDDAYVVGDKDAFGNDRVVRNHVDVGAVEHALRETISYVVNTPEDVLNPNDGLVSLREAILYQQYLVAQGEIDESTPITFDPEVFVDGTVIQLGASATARQSVTYEGVYENQRADDTIWLNSATSTGALVIDGSGANVVVDCSKFGHAIRVDQSSARDAYELTVKNLTFQNGEHVLETRTENVVLNVIGCEFNGSGKEIWIRVPKGANSTITIVDSTFNGGSQAVQFDVSGSMTVVNSTFAGQTANALFSNASDNVYVEGCVFSSTPSAIATPTAGDSFVVVNSLFTDATVAISFNNFADAQIINNTIICNDVTGTSGIVYKNSNVTIANTLVWNYKTDVSGSNTTGYTTTVVNSIAQDGVTITGNVNGAFALAAVGTACPLDADGSILDSAVRTTDGSNFQILDGGDDSYVDFEHDVYGNTRVVGDHVDVGAVELQTSSDSNKSNSLLDEVFAEYFDEFWSEI